MIKRYGGDKMASTLTKALGIIALLVVLFLAFTAFSNVLFLCQDDTEGGIPGVDMAALWSFNGGFTWIYPGSSHDPQGRTLHNIYMLNDPYQEVKEIMQYTYGVTPHILVIINDEAASHFLGVNPINETRLRYTSEGLDDKREIALYVPSIESWKEDDDIHFGNAGEGKVIAWVRFGDTKITHKESDEDIQKRIEDFCTQLVNEEILNVAEWEHFNGETDAGDAWFAEGAEFKIDKYADMADLIAADPIHDVDEAYGWPVLKEDN